MLKLQNLSLGITVSTNPSKVMSSNENSYQQESLLNFSRYFSLIAMLLEIEVRI